MSASLGVGVSRDAVRAVLVRGSEVAWSATAPVAEGDALHAVLARLLASVPRRRWERVRLTAAIGPSAAQAKRLSGLPPVKNRRDLAALLAANAGRFFLRNGVPLQLTDLHVAGPGEIWGGAIEVPVMEEIALAARQAGVRFEGARPSVAVLPYALDAGDGEARWQDGDVCADVRIHGRRLTAVRRLPATAGAESQAAQSAPALHPALAALDGDGWTMADAFGAAMAPSRAPLALYPHASERGGHAAGWSPLAAAAVAALLTVSAALFAPALTASRAAAKDAARTEELNASQRELARTRGQLVQGATTLGHVADFAARRRSMLRLLADVGATTPESTAFVSLRVDSVGGSFTAITPSAADVLPALAEVTGIASASISSPVTREAGISGDLERVSIAFRRAPARGPAAPRAVRRGAE